MGPFTIFLMILGLVCVGREQAPQAFNYQAMVRDAAGNFLSNRAITLRLAMVNAGAAGAILYHESFEWGLPTLPQGLYIVNCQGNELPPLPILLQ